MSDPIQMLKRQAQWQKNRQSLTWPEKLRLAERVLESVRQWRARPSPVTRRTADQARNESAGPFQTLPDEVGPSGIMQQFHRPRPVK